MMTSGDAGSLAVALGIGLLIGIERERRKGTEADRGAAGLRTFALVALAGALCALAGSAAVAVGGAFTALAALAAYLRSRGDDPGLTTEFAMLVTFLLGVLATHAAALAAGAGVAVALLLATRSRLHGFARDLLTERELHDGLLLAAAATIVLPLLPDRPVDPWGVLNPRTLWLLAVVVMAINALGHVALRVFGARVGLLLAGLAGGFASSTATTAAMGAMAQRTPELARTCAAAALVSNTSTVVQLALVVGLLSPALLATLAWPLAAAGAAIGAFALQGVAARAARGATGPTRIAGRAFEPRHALVFIAVVAVVMLASALMLRLLGDAALTATLAVSGFADVHAAAASAAQLVADGRTPPDRVAPGIALALAANSTGKALLAFAVGGRAFGLRLLPGLVAMTAAFGVAVALRG